MATGPSQMSIRLQAVLVRIGLPRLVDFPITFVITTAIAIVLAVRGAHSWHWWLLSYAVVFLTSCVGMEVGFHRLLAHRAFVVPKLLEHVLSVIGTLGAAGSPVGWVSMHHLHHAHTDRRGDPHDPRTLRWRALCAYYDLSGA